MPDKKVVKAESELRNIFHELKRREQESGAPSPSPLTLTPNPTPEQESKKKMKSAREIAEEEKRFGELSLQRAREEEFQVRVRAS